MSCATSFHFKMIECCCVATLPKSFITTKASVSPLFTRHFNFLPSFVSFKSKILPFRTAPFVVEASEEGEIGIGYEEKVEIEANGSDDTFTWVSNDSNADSVQVLQESDGGDSYVDPPEEAKLFVGNLPYDVDSEKLAEIFDKAGLVEISEVIYNRQTDQSRGFGFVTMSSVEEAEKAVEMFNGFELDGRQLTVNKAAQKGAQPERTPRRYEPAFRMYVGNLPWQVDNTRLEQVFSEHGKVVDARVVYDRETGRSRGFGFVTMSSEDELNDAIAALDGQNLDGRAIRVNVAEERSRRGF